MRLVVGMLPVFCKYSFTPTVSPGFTEPFGGTRLSEFRFAPAGVMMLATGRSTKVERTSVLLLVLGFFRLARGNHQSGNHDVGRDAGGERFNVAVKMFVKCIQAGAAGHTAYVPYNYPAV